MRSTLARRLRGAILLGAGALAGCGSSPATGDGGVAFACKTPPSDLAACRVDADCAIVLVGCYCGAQPAHGVARRYGDTATSCEAMAGDTCALGCITTPGFLAQDGRTVAAQGAIAVRCESASACKTYVP